MAGPLHGLPALPPPLPPAPKSVKPPRPPNSWILYRAWKLKNLPPVAPGEARRSQSDVSSVVAVLWKNESKEMRNYFERLADEAKADHKLKYPDYRYQPQKKEEKSKSTQKGKSRKKDARASRGVSHETETPATYADERPGHPYPSSSRPARDAYDRVGPSPPLSAASSPSDASSPLPSFFNHPYLDTVSGSSAPTNPPTSSDMAPTSLPSLVTETFPPLPSSSTPFIYTPQSATDTQQWQLVDQGLPSEPVQSVSEEWNQEPIPSADTQPDALYFDIPSAQIGDWPASDPSCGHGPHEHNYNCLSLLDFNPAALVEDHQGEIEVSVGTLPSPHNPLTFEQLFPQDDTSLPFNLDQDFIQHGQQDFNELFFDIDPQFTFVFDNDASEPAQSTSQAPVEVTSYAPPSGAGQSATRRVAANWATYVRDMETTTAHYEVSV